MKSPMHQTAEGLGEVMQMISSLILSILFIILGLFISKYFFIGIPVTLFLVYIFIPLVNSAKKFETEYEKHKIRQQVRDFRN